MRIETFNTVARGVGRKDYTRAVARSLQPFITPSLRQERFTLSGATWVLPTFPFPAAWLGVLVLPQDDGSWGFTASSIVVNFYELHTSTNTNNLVFVCLWRFASLADYFAGIVAERSPQIFAYTRATIEFLKGIPTQKGSLYAIAFSVYNDRPTFEATLECSGIATELTPPWMGWGLL